MELVADESRRFMIKVFSGSGKQEKVQSPDHTGEPSHLLPDLGTKAASHHARDDASKLRHPAMPQISVILT